MAGSTFNTRNTSRASHEEVTSRWSQLNMVQLVLTALAMGALCGLPFLTTAANRLVSGVPVYFFSLLSSQAVSLPALVTLFFIALLAMVFCKRGRVSSSASVVASVVLIPCLLWLAASQATVASASTSPISRTSPGSGFWLALLASWLMLVDALQRLKVGYTVRAMVFAAVTLPVLFMLLSGACNDLSIMKEYANRADEFWPAVLQHIEIVAVALLITLCIGLPLGWAAYRFQRLSTGLFPVLNIVQTIPSIALFGLLMAPLAWLAASWPALGAAGISGVGMAPGVMALVLYSLLPVTRGMLTGLAQVPISARQAASGLGMSGAQIFWQVQAPLALPVVLGGVRTATVQAVGLAAVTALIGAGGLGAIMFEGLYANAQDLVLLGVLPIACLGVLADMAFKGLQSWALRSAGAAR